MFLRHFLRGAPLAAREVPQGRLRIFILASRAAGTLLILAGWIWHVMILLGIACLLMSLMLTKKPIPSSVNE
jgi:hypothetical protein